MDKERSDFIASNQLLVTERKNLSLNGVKKIESFDNEEFLLETNLGYLIVKGEGLEIVKLDTYKGNVSIKGMVNSLSYIDQLEKTKSKESVIGRLFKWWF